MSRQHQQYIKSRRVQASIACAANPGTTTLPSDPKRKIYTGPGAISVIRKHLKELSDDRFQIFIEKEDQAAGLVTHWVWIPDQGGRFHRSSAYQIAGGQYDKTVSHKTLSRWIPGSLEDMKKKAGVPLKNA